MSLMMALLLLLYCIGIMFTALATVGQPDVDNKKVIACIMFWPIVASYFIMFGIYWVISGILSLAKDRSIKK
jgi:uncharacterized membrane protein